MWFSDFRFASAIYLYCILAVTVASPTHGEHSLAQRDVQCQESKLVVNPDNKATTVKIVTKSGDTLFSVDSTKSTMNDFDTLLTYLNLSLFPEDGYVLQGNNTDYFIIKHPLENGINITLVDKQNTPIFSKKIEGSNEGLTKTDVKCAHISGFKVVVERDLDVNHIDSYNMTALVWATLFGQKDLVKDLVKKGAKVNLPGSYGTLPLISAITAGQADIVEFLINHGAAVNEEGGWRGTSPLHIAAYKGRLECVRILLKHGANVNSLTEGGTPLHFAVLGRHSKTVQELVRKGAEINARGKKNITALHIAVGMGSEELVHYLLQSGADLNSKNKDGTTPLMSGISFNDNEDAALAIIKHLFEHHSPDVNAKDNKGNTALSLAASKGYSKVQEYLKAHGAQ